MAPVGRGGGCRRPRPIRFQAILDTDGTDATYQWGVRPVLQDRVYVEDLLHEQFLPLCHVRRVHDRGDGRGG
jgi:hypothetical protein